MSFFSGLRKLLVLPGDIKAIAPSKIPDIVQTTFRTMLRVCNRYMYTPEQLLAALITIYNVQPSCSDYADMLVRMDDLSLINPSIRYSFLWSNVVAKQQPLDIFHPTPSSLGKKRKRGQAKSNLTHHDREPVLAYYRESNRDEDREFISGMSAKKVKKIKAKKQPERECRYTKQYQE
ncbi:hypothetical protein JCM24511_08849 [Saitozyma sp. JCM 24511]|nr:hypothetical protein JCM24511_08849 [Saitozyma sp. JCM 24511]